MFSLDKLPTDHLYKFLTIFGLVLISLSYFVDERSIKLHNEIIDVKCKLDQIINEQDSVEDELKEMTIVHEGIRKRALELIKKPKKENLPELKDLDSEISEQRKLISINRKRLLIINNTLALTKARNEKADYMLSKLKIWQTFSTLGVIIGCIFFFGGLILWYLNVQRPMDLQARTNIIKVTSSNSTQNENPEHNKSV